MKKIRLHIIYSITLIMLGCSHSKKSDIRSLESIKEVQVAVLSSETLNSVYVNNVEFKNISVSILPVKQGASTSSVKPAATETNEFKPVPTGSNQAGLNSRRG